MKKILFVAHMHSHIMNFHQPFIKRFLDKGYDVYVATKLDKITYSDFERNFPNVKWINIDFTRNPISKDIFTALNQLVDLMKKIKFDLIHVHTPVGSVLGRIAAKKTKNGPVLYTAHGFHFYKGAPMLYWLTYYQIEKFLSKWTDAIITINEEDFLIVKNKFYVDNNNIFKVDGVGVDLSKFNNKISKDINFKNSLNLKDEDFVITVVAELSKRKNQIQIINAMENIVKNNKDIKVLLVGKGELYKEYLNVIKRKKLENNIYLLGYRTDVQKIINISDVIGLFSIHEGLPKNLLEAIASGKPIICTDIRGNNDLVVDNINGVLVKLNDIEETSKKITYLYENREKLKVFENNNKKIANKYCINKILNEMDKIYYKFL